MFKTLLVEDNLNYRVALKNALLARIIDVAINEASDILKTSRDCLPLALTKLIANSIRHFPICDFWIFNKNESSRFCPNDTWG